MREYNDSDVVAVSRTTGSVVKLWDEATTTEQRSYTKMTYGAWKQLNEANQARPPTQSGTGGDASGATGQTPETPPTSEGKTPPTDAALLEALSRAIAVAGNPNSTPRAREQAAETVNVLKAAAGARNLFLNPADNPSNMTVETIGGVRGLLNKVTRDFIPLGPSSSSSAGVSSPSAMMQAQTEREKLQELINQNTWERDTKYTGDREDKRFDREEAWRRSQVQSKDSRYGTNMGAYGSLAGVLNRQNEYQMPFAAFEDQISGANPYAPGFNPGGNAAWAIGQTFKPRIYTPPDPLQLAWQAVPWDEEV